MWSGKTIAEAVRHVEIPEQTYYRWRKEYGGMSSAEAKQMKLLEKENAAESGAGGAGYCWLKRTQTSTFGQAEGGDALCNGSPWRRRASGACRVLRANRTTHRYEPRVCPMRMRCEQTSSTRPVSMGRVGYRMVCHMMRNEGRKINHKRVERIWREEGD